MQRGLDAIARVLVRADDMDGVAHGLHSLLIDEDLVLFGEFTGEHQDFLASHSVPPCFRSLGSPGVRAGIREADIDVPVQPPAMPSDKGRQQPGA
jgi:hypothetical protein